jgi:hypothetical protein
MKGATMSSHAAFMLQERAIPESWMWRTLNEADRVDVGTDGNLHYVKAIPEFGGRFLHVVVNPETTPMCVVTLFFDRRLGKADHANQA